MSTVRQVCPPCYLLSSASARRGNETVSDAPPPPENAISLTDDAAASQTEIGSFYNSSFSACEDARGYDPEIDQRLTSFRTRPRPAGVSGIFQFLFSACEDARGYGPENHQRITSFRTRPRLAGVSGILLFLFLRVRGRTRVHQQRSTNVSQIPFRRGAAEPPSGSIAAQDPSYRGRPRSVRTRYSGNPQQLLNL